MNSDRKNCLYRSSSYAYQIRQIYQVMPFKSTPSDDKQITIQKMDDGSSYSNRYISKQMLLGTDFSPCDFLLSYCKQFGLYIYKDRVEDKIYIKTRKNFYHRDNIIDIQDKIDRLKDISVKPLNIDYGFFALTNSGVSSSFYDDYVNKYGKVYGQKIIATGYDFNADTKNLIDSVFKGAVQAKEMSQYFYTPNAKVHPYMYNSVKYALYENGDYESGSTDVNAPFKVITEEFDPYDNEFAGYDYVSKPMFYDSSRKALGTEYTMLFFNGYESIPASYNWNLTDDIGAMYNLNNNPCWLMTISSADTNGNVIALPITQFPRFSRWYEGNKWMIYSWDFGSPRELYVPNMTNNDEGNIYWNYFKTYYEDSYDVNSKVVEAYVINKDFTQDDLRNFYWFDNSIWRLNKIEDYNVTSFEGTKCEFVKVQDVNNYTNEEATTELWMKVTLDKYILPVSGGTLVGTVRTSDNFGWNLEGIGIYPTGDTAYTLTISPESWGSSGNFFVTAGTNSGSDKVVTIVISAGDISKSVQFIQSGELGGLSVSPTALTFAASGESLTLSVTNPVGYEWEVVGRPNWITASPTSGSATASTITLTASRNDDDERTGSFVIWNKTKNETIVISLSQLVVPYIRFVPSATTFSSSGGTAVINVESNVDWTLEITGDTPSPTPTGLSEYLTFEIISGGTIYWRKSNGSATSKTIYYSKDSGSTWTSITSTTGGASISVNAGDKVMFKGDNYQYYSNGYYNQFFTYSWDDIKFNIRGNIMSIIDSTGFATATTLSAYGALSGLFSGCTALVSAEDLIMPATSLTESCYSSMFYNCTNLTTAPLLPASTLANSCYSSMFYRCSSLNNIRCLATNISASYCTYYWVSGVSATGTFYKDSSMSSWTTGNNGIPNGWTVQDYNPQASGSVEFVFASTEDFGEFNIEITTLGVDNVVNVDGISETGTLVTGFTSGKVFSIGVQNLNSLGQGSRHIGISYAPTPSYDFVEVPAGQFTWLSSLIYEQGKKVYIQVY